MQSRLVRTYRVTQGTLRLDPIALYDSTRNEFIASAFRAETSVKLSWLSSQFPQTHRTGDFQPSFSGRKRGWKGDFIKRSAKSRLKSQNSARRRSGLLG